MPLLAAFSTNAWSSTASWPSGLFAPVAAGSLGPDGDSAFHCAQAGDAQASSAVTDAMARKRIIAGTRMAGGP